MIIDGSVSHFSVMGRFILILSILTNSDVFHFRLNGRLRPNVCATAAAGKEHVENWWSGARWSDDTSSRKKGIRILSRATVGIGHIFAIRLLAVLAEVHSREA